MIVRVLVQSDDRKNLVECRIPDLSELGEEEAKEILWQAYETGRMRLEEKLVEK